MRALQSAAEASVQALLQDNANCVAHVLQSHFFTRTASPSVSSSWERAASRPPINVSPYVHTRDCGDRRRSTAASCEAVLGTLQDAMHALHADNTSSYRRVESELFGADRLLDACVLETLVARTKETPYRYVGLKHVKYQSLLDDERHAEEFLLLETAGKGVHPHSGHKFVFKMLRSVNVPGKEFEMRSANSHHAQLQVHRGAIHAMLLVLAETSHRGILKMNLWLDVELTKCTEPFYGAFSSLHDAYSLSIRYRQLVENYAVTSGDAACAASTKTSRFDLLAPRSDRERKCQTCQRALGFFSRKKKHLCSVCGIFVCSSCLSSTSFQSWKLCGLCYQRNKNLVNRTRVSKMSSLASGLGGTLQYISRIGRSHSRQRDSILFATAEAAGELPPNPMQDTKQRPSERFANRDATTRRRRIDDDEMLFDNEIKPLARSVVGVRRAVRSGAANGDSIRDGNRPPQRGQNSLSMSHVVSGKQKHHRTKLQKATRSSSYDPYEDSGSSRDVSGSSFDGTNGSFRTSELSSTPVQISRGSSSFVEPNVEPVPATDTKTAGGSTTSDSTTSSGSVEQQGSPTPEPDLLRVGPQRVPAPAPSKPVEQPRANNYPPRRANPLHCVPLGDHRRSRGSNSSRSSSSSSSCRSPSPSSSTRRTAFKVWASASAGPRMVSQKTSSSREIAKFANDPDTAQVPSDYLTDDFGAPDKRGRKVAHLTELDDQPQHGRLYEWI
uniref:FYVE-type domain-containing protein n=1 Tax=Hyaloperonospora arabidopsidis (strain Emoy2) TaxID=559515 RepID=M4B7C2_HYAAE